MHNSSPSFVLLIFKINSVNIHMACRLHFRVAVKIINGGTSYMIKKGNLEQILDIEKENMKSLIMHRFCSNKSHFKENNI